MNLFCNYEKYVVLFQKTGAIVIPVLIYQVSFSS